MTMAGRSESRRTAADAAGWLPDTAGRIFHLQGFAGEGASNESGVIKNGDFRLFYGNRFRSIAWQRNLSTIGVGAQSTLGGTTFLPEKYV